VAGCYEQSNEILNSIRGHECFDSRSIISSQEGLCFITLISAVQLHVNTADIFIIAFNPIYPSLQVMFCSCFIFDITSQEIYIGSEVLKTVAMKSYI
jgi:hypothetical protein